jgi:hypothetical protein
MSRRSRLSLIGFVGAVIATMAFVWVFNPGAITAA